MAARSNSHTGPHLGEVVELRKIVPEQLAEVLKEETSVWRDELDWDFSPSAGLVHRFVQAQALNGYALVLEKQIVGYSYYVCEEGKGLIGDLYVLAAHRTVENENALLQAVLDAMWHTPGVRRLEAQLMMLSAPSGGRVVPYQNCLRSHMRYFLEAPLETVASLAPRELTGVAVSPWLENRQEETARLIAKSYQGHVDGTVNDQYRSPGGARRFLMNIVQFPGCGTFFAPASYAADSGHRSLCGVLLASLVASDAGHITQVCVAPSHQGIGLGYELMRRSMAALASHGCRSASLTVTASNEPAVRLYRQMGFVHRREFAAYVWDPR